MSAVEKFPILLSEAEEESSAVPPCFSDEGINVRSTYYSPIAFPSLCETIQLASLSPNALQGFHSLSHPVSLDPFQNLPC